MNGSLILTNMKDYVLGIDIGGTNTVYGLVERDGTLLYESSIVTKEYETPQHLIDTIRKDVFSQVDFHGLVGIGIGAPNGNFYTGSIEFAPNLHWKGIIPLAKLFSESFNCPTVLTNDANAAAIGEHVYGCAKAFKNFVTITLGTGLGSGVFVDGDLVYGHDGFAGEYGHIRVIPDGRDCGCGRKGCLETYVSSTGVVRSIKELESTNKEFSDLLKMEKPSAKDVFVLAEKGDVFANEILDYTVRILANALADFTCFSSPEAFVLFGGIAQNGNSFAKRVKDEMEKNMLNIYKNKVAVKISKLHDKNAAVLGSASLVWKEIGIANE